MKPRPAEFESTQLQEQDTLHFPVTSNFVIDLKGIVKTTLDKNIFQNVYFTQVTQFWSDMRYISCASTSSELGNC